MTEAANWMLIGPGNVGGELARQVEQPHVAERLGLQRLPSYVIRSGGVVMGPDGITPTGHSNINEIEDFPEVTFVAMGTTADGHVAKDYISTALERGKIVVTAEKGSLANHFDYLRNISNNFESLGINGSVGGGTRLMEVACQYSQDIGNISQIHLALNGTLSAIMSSVAPPEGNGMSLGQAVHQAVELKYAEPDAETPYDVIRGEAEGDIPKKTSIFANKLGLFAKSIDWQEFEFTLSDGEIAQAVEEAKVRRFLVSFYSPLGRKQSVERPEEGGIIGGFEAPKDIEGWRVVLGFRHIDRNPLFSHLAKMTGPGAGVVLGLGPDETDGVYSVTGPGAGVRPTANTMLDDYMSRRHLISEDNNIPALVTNL